jgi:hypothetical protein
MNLRNELLDPETIPNEWLIERMRDQRNVLLIQSDWTQVVDSSLSDSKKAEWATYRQALRDFPSTWTPAETAEFPDQPS